MNPKKPSWKSQFEKFRVLFYDGIVIAKVKVSLSVARIRKDSIIKIFVFFSGVSGLLR